MALYYVNKNAQDNGDHEVYRMNCQFMPEEENRIYLGNFSSCRPAVKEARGYFPQANGCYFCSRECHTG